MKSVPEPSVQRWLFADLDSAPHLREPGFSTPVRPVWSRHTEWSWAAETAVRPVFEQLIGEYVDDAQRHVIYA